MVLVVSYDVVFVFKGYYFCGVFYGYEMYYFNVMVGFL